MTSEKQILANQANALKSTGPRTAEGKAVSSRNALTHGLLSSRVLVKGENPEEFETFRAHLLCDLDPVGQLEILLAERVIAFFWRLRRAGRMEQGLLDLLCENPEKADSVSNNDIPFQVIIHKTYEEPADDPEYQEFLKYKEQIGSIPRSHPDPAAPKEPNQPAGQQKQDLAIELAASEKKDPPPLPEPPQTEENKENTLGRVVQSDFSGRALLERLLRYEGQIERGLYRALTELQKLQYIRKRNEAILIRPEEVPQDSPVSSS